MHRVRVLSPGFENPLGKATTTAYTLLEEAHV